MSINSKIVFIVILFVSQLSIAAIIQGKGNASKNNVNDNYFGYQWYLYNLNQVVSKNIHIQKTETIYSKPHNDMSWGFIQKLKIKRDAVVAIIDTGVNLSNKDLKGKFLLNKKECKNSKIIDLRSTQDKDNNGYVADCMGWDFTALDKEGNFTKKARKVTDEVGHGTHLAGLLVAKINNEIGIAGLSSKIKILPLKVVRKNFRHPKSTLVDRVTKAILYAVDRKVDVINMSMGWPLAGERSVAFKKALVQADKAGITIVAAVGNNNHNKSIFPCANQSVICVGSYDIDGKASSFSNYGGHVDVLAPGDEILSIAKKSSSGLSNSFIGVSIKSGTSQASPLVAGVVALLKAQQKGISHKAILERLYFSSGSGLFKDKYFLNGILNVKKFFSVPNRPIVRPNFKESPLVVAKDLKANYKFKITNYSRSPVNNVELRFNFKSRGLRPLQNRFLINNLVAEKEINIPLVISDITAGSFIPLTVQVFINGKGDGTYRHEITVSKKQSPWHSFKLSKNNIWLDRPLKTLKSHLSEEVSKYPEFYQFKKINNALNINILRKSSTSYKRLGVLQFPELDKLIYLTRVDLNYDGQLDYLISGYIENTKNPYKKKGDVFFAYYDKNLKPLFGSKNNSHWFYKADGAIISNYHKLSFVHYQHPLFGQIKIPLSHERRREVNNEHSQLSLDLNQDYFEFDSISEAKQLFYFVPQKEGSHISVKLRLFEDHTFRQHLVNSLSIEFDEAINYHGVVSQSKNELSSGTVKFIISIGSGRELAYYLLSLSKGALVHKKTSIEKLNHQGMKILGFTPTKYLDLSPSLSFMSQKTSFFGNFSVGKTSAQVVHFDKEQRMFSDSTAVRHKLEKDYITRILTGFSFASERYTSLLTTSNILSVYQSRGQVRSFVVPIVRSSFLPDVLFKESLTPIVIKSGGRLSPGYFVNGTEISTGSIYVWKLSPQGVIAPMSHNLHIPKNCKVKLPFNSPIEKASYAIYVCGTGSQDRSINFIRL